MKRFGYLSLMILLSCLLSACGFHLRNASELPAQLHTLYYSPENPYEPVATELQTTLTSLNLRLVSSPRQAEYTLRLSKSNTRHSQANLSDTSQASTISYSQNVNVSIINNRTKSLVISSNFSASVSQYLNQNQIMTANTSSLASQSLPHDLVTHIFIWLTTDRVKDALDGKIHVKKRHV
jgi:outer membrane lipopolysaccharide assembly protein LptE/RlpB